MRDLLKRGLAAKRESKYVEFKREFDPASKPQWCEILKDIVAMTNTGGGIILFGLDSQGQPVSADLRALLAVDPADITDQVHKYTGYHFTEFELIEAAKAGSKVATLVIHGVSIPLVFHRPGTYAVDGGKQRTAFSQGTVYFRHGAKSEPGTTEDIRRSIERQLDGIRKEWLQGVRKVVTAPAGAKIMVATDVTESTSPEATPIRIVEDPEVPAYRKLDPDDTHPFRQKELICEVRKRLPKGVAFNSYDVLSIKRLHDLEGINDYCHQPRFGSLQYSRACVDWIVGKYKGNNAFFSDTRQAFYDQQHGG